MNEVILLGLLQFWGFLWPQKLTLIGYWMNFNSAILFPWWLKAIFFTRCLYFHHNWWKERGTTINSSNIFEGCYWGKYLEIHKHNKLPTIWIFKKLNNLKSKTTFEAKLPYEQNLHVLWLELPLPWTNSFHRFAFLWIWVIEIQL